ncbi:MAG: NRDE family protein, partial [Rhodospirillales bacterium]|nr:NRDE family protein [Rhodospirillales bacterium]
MCTVVILRRATHPWPILIAANRDEMIDRPWDPPARHWSDREDVIGGRDRLAGGTWLAMNDSGVVAAILNRRNSLGPAEGFR